MSKDRGLDDRAAAGTPAAAHAHPHPHGGHEHPHADDERRDRGHGHGHGHAGHGHDHGDHDDHDHGSGPWAKVKHMVVPHSHDSNEAIQSAEESSSEGIRAAWIGLGGMGVTAVLQMFIVAISGSIALLADTLHNVGHAATTIPLVIAFRIGQRRREQEVQLRLPSRRGPGRAVHLPDHRRLGRRSSSGSRSTPWSTRAS